MHGCMHMYMDTRARTLTHTHKDKILSEIDMIVCDSSLTSYNTYDNNNTIICTLGLLVIVHGLLEL